MYSGTMTVADPALIDEFTEGLPEGFTAYVLHDELSYHDSPRDWAPNGATLIQRNDRLIDIDSDDEGLAEARDHFSKYDERRSSYPQWYYDTYLKSAVESRHTAHAMMNRYLSIFRPEILHYRDYWSFGQESYGWGYVTADAMREIGFDGDEVLDRDKAAEVFDAELDVYSQWAEGNVYVVIVNHEDGYEAALGGVYDDWNWKYTKSEIIPDLISEIEHQMEESK